MDPKVKRTLALMAIAAALFTISESYKEVKWMIYVQGASAGFALAGIVGFILILGEQLRRK
ncbi:hypothetical protein [Mucilaginibacter myungsuensis]|uniref:Uncharacterized protein n=1 Tax=Mucilaginibacter myungsuensis TaxID=649104 RepID=A0A929KZW0_9SPHI|nr:hypothetical protein [Mucilaginibacter myungsuensis]MBE9663523.1 hypothetical protein [Mucilaginibacter myungsuensis]MDN3600261.1 hypothetical protein [Mucilaginibacter myungsuensis]